MPAAWTWDWSSVWSLLATLVFLRTVYQNFLPPELHHFVNFLFHGLMVRFHTDTKIIIDEYNGHITNELYDAAQTYLGDRCLHDASVFCLFKRCDCDLVAASLPSHHTTYDRFNGIPLCWSSVVDPSRVVGSSRPAESHSLQLSFHRRHGNDVRSLYIPHVLHEAEYIRLRSRERRLYTNQSDFFMNDHHSLWSAVPFSHPSTFETLAIDPVLRDDIREDLLRFVDRRGKYSSVGRSWKRGYLLHGPPGTGKTSLVAAMANFLEFDVYDLELSTVTSNTLFRRLLVSTTPKSILVIEDVDCSLDLSDHKKNTKSTESKESEAEYSAGGNRTGTTVSLSGTLNFVDGLWSSCVGERLMIFTTNHPERLDPLLLRPGRMDRKIHLSYCRPAAFRVLARNYLEVGEEHELMAEAEALLEEVEMTPADIAEIFMGCDSKGKGADVAMKKAVAEMRRRKEEGGGSGGARWGRVVAEEEVS